MVNESFVGCIAITDNENKPNRVLEVKTLTKSAYKELVKKASENLKELTEKKDKELKEKQEKEMLLYSRLDKMSIVIAYLMFNEIVERGKANTTNEFEDMFACWLIGKCEIAIELCPKEYLYILERLGVDYGRN